MQLRRAARLPRAGRVALLHAVAQREQPVVVARLAQRAAVLRAVVQLGRRVPVLRAMAQLAQRAAVLRAMAQREQRLAVVRRAQQAAVQVAVRVAPLVLTALSAA